MHKHPNVGESSQPGFSAAALEQPNPKICEI